MVNFKRYSRILLLLVGLVFLLTLIFGFSYKKQREGNQHNNLGFLYKKDITNFEVVNIRGEKKEIKNRKDRNRIIDLINSVNIIKSGVQPPIGCGYGVIITYSNGEKFSARFTGVEGTDYMAYSSGDRWVLCHIDKDINEAILDYYYR